MAADTGLPTTLKLEVATPKGLMLSIETTSVQAALPVPTTVRVNAACGVARE